jgi:cysteine sulfinate desulfinase/cysteine desulfurase-like protein
MGYSLPECYASIRLSLGIFNTIEEIDQAANSIVSAWKKLMV